MDLIKKESNYHMAKSFLLGFIALFFFISCQDLSGQNTVRLTQPSKQVEFRSALIKGRLTQINTTTPVSYAEVTCSDKTSFTKSNSNGEFNICPTELPTSIKIKKFGFNEETVIINKPVDSILVALTPLSYHKNSSGLKKPLQYELLLKRALEKFRISNNEVSLQERKLVYCRTVSSIDSTPITLFEGYAQMSVNKFSVQEGESWISRYVSDKEFIPGLSENKLEFEMNPFINLPMFIERFMGRRGYVVQNGNMIAVINVDLKKTRNVYYINIADTSIIHITSIFKSGNRNRIQQSVASLQNYCSLTDISLVKGNENSDEYIIGYVSQKEDVRLVQKRSPDKIISKSTLFTTVPDSSLIYNVVREQVLYESLAESSQQINFFPNISAGDHSDFDSEIEKLFMKPYKHNFWAQYSFVAPDSNELIQIRNWENENMFFSEDRLPASGEISNADSLIALLNNNLVALENVYIETDRNYYLAGDTIWFSAFVLDNQNMDSTSLSKILYVDLINTDNKLEKHIKLLIRNGRAKGDFTLAKNVENGKYRLRAYTQYMRNFQSEFLFEKDIPVYQSDFNRNILVTPVINKGVDGDSIELYIQTILTDEYVSLEKKLEVIVRLNDTLTIKKIFDFKKVLNGFMGFFVPTSLNCSSVDILLTLSDKTIISTQKLSLNLNSEIILQFFPESGKLVDGIETVIAFKALDNSGNPTEFSADIIDENQKHITHITGDRTGIGKFNFTPDLSHSYKARLTSGVSTYEFNLSAIEPRGYVLNFNSDSNKLLIKNNQYSLKNSHLLVSVRGLVYSSTEIKSDTNILQIDLQLKEYPKGILQITLFDSLFRPQAERLVFNNRQDQKMLIHIETDKKMYGQKEKVNLTIRCSDVEGNPVQSSLTLSVVDHSRSDSTINSPDIESYLYVTSELKGKIDYNLFNLSDTTCEGNIKRDLVMMTQGWRNFLWNSIRYTNTINLLYPVEKGFFIDGSVLHSNTRRYDRVYNLNYLDYNSGFNGVTQIDEKRKFEIDLPLFYDSHIFIIQNRNENDRIENLDIYLDTIHYPEINFSNNRLSFINYSASYLNALNYRFAELDSIFGQEIKYINLPEVKIRARSHYSYSTPDVVIDLNKKDPSGKKYSSVFELIYEEFGEKAFTAQGFNAKGNIYNPILVVDGYPYTASNCPPCYSNDYQMATRVPVNAISDVKFYEAGSNFSKWLTPPPRAFTPPKEMFHPLEHLYALPVVSITTYSDSYRGDPKGTIVFPFQGIYQHREFYQPIYTNKNKNVSDNRTTIYWNPEIKTDSTGVAKLSFYNSDLKGKSKIKVSGLGNTMKEASSSFSYYWSK